VRAPPPLSSALRVGKQPLLSLGAPPVKRVTGY